MKYPFKYMEIGDSFIIGEYKIKNSNAARSWAAYRGNNWKFAQRKTKDNKIRIWRVDSMNPKEKAQEMENKDKIMGYKIEKGIELYKPGNKKYSFSDMKVGDSFIIGGYTKESMIKYSNAGNNWAKAYNEKHKTNFKFSVRKVEGCNVRIIRIK